MAPLSHLPIAYHGSKRRLAPSILAHFRPNIDTLYEPFAGSAAVSLSAALHNRAQSFILGDSHIGLIDIWHMILSSPLELSEQYADLWHQQASDPCNFYNRTRDAFNETGGAARLLFLLTRCVKNSVRFNDSGHFNQAPDHRRLGTRPARMRQRILSAHNLLAGRCQAIAADYVDTIATATPNDLVYLDPPYQGTSAPRYHQALDRSRLISVLDQLNRRGISCIVSFDGRSGENAYGPGLPSHLGLTRLELHAGRSSQATLHGRVAYTYESLYISEDLSKQVKRRN